MKVAYSVAHTIVNEITLLELGGDQKFYNLEGKDYFRFVVMGTNRDTGLRKQFNLALVSGLTSTQRGSLDSPYCFSMLDETVEELLAGYGYFITGNLPRGGQIERAFERCILAPSSCVYTLTGGQKVVFEGRQRVFSIEEVPIDSSEFAERVDGRQYVVMAGKHIYPYMVEDIPRWGENKIKTVNCNEIYSEDVRRCIINHYQTSRQLPEDRFFPASLLQQREGAEDKVVDRIDRPKFKPTKSDIKVSPERKPRQQNKLSNMRIGSDKKDTEELVRWQLGLRELDEKMKGGLRRGEFHTTASRRSA